MSNEPNTRRDRLSSGAQARWDALKDTVGELAGAAGDPDGFAAAFAALTQIGQGVDLEEVLNALHVPDDAGEHAAALRRMLLRIPDGWGRRIGCSRGWYPILVELDQQLSALLPGHELHQVKEKYSGLRFYCSQGERVTNPADLEPDPPNIDGAAEASKEAAWTEWESAHHAWSERLEHGLDTEDGSARRAGFDRRSELAEQLVEAAERRASVTCERCGQPGESCCTPGPHPWHQTLCAPCARERGYVQASREDAGG